MDTEILHMQVTRPTPQPKNPQNMRNTVQCVGGASLTQSTRAPWSVELAVA